MPPRRPLLLLALSLLLVGALAFAILAGGSSNAPGTASTTSAPAGSEGATQTVAGSGGFDGAALPGSAAAPGFRLVDQYGRSVSLSELRGKPVLLAFVYSTCGAPCIVIAQQIRGAIDELSDPVHVVLVSADPAADTPQSVRAFLAQVSLSGRALYLSGPASRLAPLWSAYHVKPASSGRSAFASYATVTLIDARGRERVLYGPEQLTPEALSHDIRELQAEPAAP